VNLEVRHRGVTVAKLTAEANPEAASDLRALLVDAIRRGGGDESEIGEYEMDLRCAGRN
jgi:integrase